MQVVTCESLQSLCNRYCCFRFVNTACRVPKTAHVANQQFTLWTSSPSPSSLDLCEKVSAKRLAEGETRGCLGSRRKSDAKNLQFQWFCMHSRLKNAQHLHLSPIWWLKDCSVPSVFNGIPCAGFIVHSQSCTYWACLRIAPWLCDGQRELDCQILIWFC